jgi:transposase-like protein
MKNGSRQKKRTRWTSEVARRVLEEWRASGVALEAFARQRGLVAQRLRWWQKQLGVGERAPARATLVPVTVRGAVDEDDRASLVIVVEGGARLEVREVSATTAAWVGVMLGTLRGHDA